MRGDLPVEPVRRVPVAAARAAAPRPRPLPDKAAFTLGEVVYLDSGSHHPISRGAKAAVEEYLAMRTMAPESQAYALDKQGVIDKFARLVNADPDELTFVQGTTAGEQMVLRALDIPAGGGHIVTDTLHFFGSIPLYEEMARRGMEVTWIRARDGRIELDDVRRAVRKGTRLVALSLVSTINGFQHDLAKVCEIAHAAGAYVYADIVHAAGCVPLDLHASGVDFAATATYKWLMGDFGLGFLYVRKDVQPKIVRAHYGYYGVGEFESHIYPLDTPGESVADVTFRDDAQGLFSLGTYSHTTIAQLHHSLSYIHDIGVANIQAHAQSLVRRLKEVLPRLGYPLMTPPETRTPIVTGVLANAREVLAPKLKAANVRITTSANRFRVSVSVFNDMDDIERLLAAIGPG